MARTARIHQLVTIGLAVTGTLILGAKAVRVRGRHTDEPLVVSPGTSAQESARHLGRLTFCLPQQFDGVG